MWVGDQRHAPAALPGERPGANCIGSWLGRCGGCGKVAPTGIRSLDRPARIQSPYRLSYRGPHGYALVSEHTGVSQECFKGAAKLSGGGGGSSEQSLQFAARLALRASCQLYYRDEYNVNTFTLSLSCHLRTSVPLKMAPKCSS